MIGSPCLGVEMCVKSVVLGGGGSTSGCLAYPHAVGGLRAAGVLLRNAIACRLESVKDRESERYRERERERTRRGSREGISTLKSVEPKGQRGGDAQKNVTTSCDKKRQKTAISACVLKRQEKSDKRRQSLHAFQNVGNCHRMSQKAMATVIINYDKILAVPFWPYPCLRVQKSTNQKTHKFVIPPTSCRVSRARRALRARVSREVSPRVSPKTGVF